MLRGFPNQSWRPWVEPRRDRLRNQPSRVAVERSYLGSLVESRTRVENLQHLPVREAKGFPIRRWQRGERLRQLAARRGMDPLQQSPMGCGRDRQRLVGKPIGEQAEQGPDGEVLVDDDHSTRCRSVVVFVWPAAEQGVRSADLRQGVSELVGQVPHHDPSKDLAAFRRDSRVTATALAPKLVEQILTGAHMTILP